MLDALSTGLMTEEWLFRASVSGLLAGVGFCFFATAMQAALLDPQAPGQPSGTVRAFEFLSGLQLLSAAGMGLAAHALAGLHDWNVWITWAVVFGVVATVVALAGICGASVSGRALALLQELPLLEGPGCRAGRGLTTVLADTLTPAGVSAREGMDEEEIFTWVEMEVAAGTLAPEEGEILLETFKLNDKVAKDCMTPRVDVASIANTLSRAEVIKVATALRHRRMPVYNETPDEVVGVLDVQDWLLSGEGRSLVQFMTPPWLVPETKSAVDLLEAFLLDENGMAVVVDEFGGFEGVVTYSDIVEELVSDALPSGEYAVYLQPLGQGRVLASGRARLDDLSEMLGHEIDIDGIDTIGGLVFTHFGQMPKANQRIEIAHLDVVVRRISGRRIEEVLVTWIGPDGDEETLP